MCQKCHLLFSFLRKHKGQMVNLPLNLGSYVVAGAHCESCNVGVPPSFLALQRAFLVTRGTFGIQKGPIHYWVISTERLPQFSPL